MQNSDHLEIHIVMFIIAVFILATELFLNA